MPRQILPIAHYQSLLYDKFKTVYTINPTEEWNGVRTQVNIYCHKHQTNRKVNLQKVFNGKNSTWACRQCFLDTLHPTDSPPTEN